MKRGKLSLKVVGFGHRNMGVVHVGSLPGAAAPGGEPADSYTEL